MKNHLIIYLAIFALAFGSCAFDDPLAPIEGVRSPLVVNARIAGDARTRAVQGTQDEWTYTDFKEGDIMGFFSSGGKYEGTNQGEAPFVNQKLVYMGGTGEPNFRDPSGSDFSPSHMKGNEIFMYYPYSDEIVAPFGVTLRTEEWPGGEKLDTARCIDFLSTRYLDVLSQGVNSTTALYGEFQHTFAELVIMRGEGFDNPPDLPDGTNKWDIKAVLNTPVTGLKVNLSDGDEPWKCTPELVWDSVTPGHISSQEAMEWKAWLGDKYYITENDREGQTAWYVIVPTIGCEAKYVPHRDGIRTKVEYIELYDNDGNLQRVSSLQLSNGNSKYVDGGWRYPMVVSMKELVPTAYPCQIVPWEGDIDLTDERKRGINNETDFYAWVAAYNAYLEDTNDEEKANALLQYGDRYKNADGTSYWHFYVLTDLNLSYYPGEGPIIKELNDILDGQSTVYKNGKFQNYHITGLSCTLIGQIAGPYGCIQNFTFDEPQVTYNDGTEPVGIIANTITTGGTVDNCRIEDGTLYCPSAPGGMVAGKAEGALIKNCTLSGFLIASSTTQYGIVGEGTFTSQNNDANNVTTRDSGDENLED